MASKIIIIGGSIILLLFLSMYLLNPIDCSQKNDKTTTDLCNRGANNIPIILLFPMGFGCVIIVVGCLIGSDKQQFVRSDS